MNKWRQFSPSQADDNRSSLIHASQIHVVTSIRAYRKNTADDDQVGSDASSAGFAVPAKPARREQS